MFLNKPFSIEQAVAIVNAQKASSILVKVVMEMQQFDWSILTQFVHSNVNTALLQ